MKRGSGKWSGGGVGLLLIVLLAGCGGGNGQVGGTPSPTAGSDVLRWSIEGVADIESLDPPRASSTQQVAVDSLIFEGLVKLDSRFSIQPAGAASWEISADSRVFTFHIRPNLKFADGSDCTADDFVYSLNRAFGKDFANGATNYYLSNISGSKDVTDGKMESASGIKTLDRLTLQITLDHPASYFLDQLTFPVAFVVPRKLVERYGASWGEHAYGTGPFILKQWQHGQGISLTPNPNYYGGAMKLAGVELMFFADASAAYRRYRDGGLDIMGTQVFNPANLDDAVNQPGFAQVAQFTDTYIGFNDAKPPFDSAMVRRAFAQAVDKQELAKRLNHAVEPADTIIPPGMPGYNPSITPVGFSPTQAQRSLADAGFSVGKGFPTVTITLNTQDPAYATVGSYLQQTWQDNLGVKVAVNSEDLNHFNADLTNLATNPATSTIQIYLSVWGADYPDPQNFLSQQLRSGVGNNNGHFTNPDFDRLVDQADAEGDLSKRIPLYRQAEQIAINDVGWLPLYYGKAYALIRPTVSGLTYTAQGLFADDWTQVAVNK